MYFTLFHTTSLNFTSHSRTLDTECRTTMLLFRIYLTGNNNNTYQHPNVKCRYFLKIFTEIVTFSSDFYETSQNQVSGKIPLV